MSKFKSTRRLKKYKRTKTLKMIGGEGEGEGEGVGEVVNKDEVDNKGVENVQQLVDDRQGVGDIIEDKANKLAVNAINTISDATLSIMGLERINNPNNENNQPGLLSKATNITNKIGTGVGGIIDDVIDNKAIKLAVNTFNTLSDDALSIVGLERINNPNNENNQPGLFSKAKNITNKIGADVIDNINTKLEQPSILNSASNTIGIIKNSARMFNNALENPIVKAELIKAINHTGEIGTLMVEAGKEPFNQAVKAAADAVPDISAAIAAGAIKIGTDAMAAVPGVGAVVEVGKIANDFSKAYGATAEAAADVIEVASDSVIVANDNYKRLLSELENKKTQIHQINNNINSSIKQFENPATNNLINNNPAQSAGRKSRRRINNRKAKSKRVRFAI